MGGVEAHVVGQLLLRLPLPREPVVQRDRGSGGEVGLCVRRSKDMLAPRLFLQEYPLSRYLVTIKGLSSPDTFSETSTVPPCCGGVGEGGPPVISGSTMAREGEEGTPPPPTPPGRLLRLNRIRRRLRRDPGAQKCRMYTGRFSERRKRWCVSEISKFNEQGRLDM